MRALVWHGTGRMSVDDVPDAEPGPGEVLLVPEAVGVCGSELEGYLGRQANRTPPLVMGHEVAGRVEAVGPGVDEGWVGAVGQPAQLAHGHPDGAGEAAGPLDPDELTRGVQVS